MLQQLSQSMAQPYATRRIAKATVAILSLIAPAASPTDIRAGHNYIRTATREFALWTTRLGRPFLWEEAADEAWAEGRDALILRCAPALQAASPLVFDWMPGAPAGGDWLFDLLPALPSEGGLSLVGSGEKPLRLDVGVNAIVLRDDLPPVWKLQRELAVARATAVLNNQLWGGL